MKKSALIENFYDHTYKLLNNKIASNVSALYDAIKIYRIKEIKTRLFPKHTEDYANAMQELENIRNEIWSRKQHYIEAITKAQEYYTLNHNHFVACKNYVNPHEINIETIINSCIEEEF